jgi:hypothetical protein
MLLRSQVVQRAADDAFDREVWLAMSPRRP